VPSVGSFFSYNSNNLRQLQRTIILEANFVHIYVLNYICLSSNILSISLYVIEWKMRNLNESNVLTTIESINRTLKKNVEKIILKIWVQNVPSSVKVGKFLLCNPKVKGKKGKQCNFSSLTSSLRNKRKITQLKLRSNLSQPHNLSNTESPYLLFEWKELNSLLT
jgi:hypothetical protein